MKRINGRGFFPELNGASSKDKLKAMISPKDPRGMNSKAWAKWINESLRDSYENHKIQLKKDCHKNLTWLMDRFGDDTHAISDFQTEFVISNFQRKNGASVEKIIFEAYRYYLRDFNAVFKMHEEHRTLDLYEGECDVEDHIINYDISINTPNLKVFLSITAKMRERKDQVFKNEHKAAIHIGEKEKTMVIYAGLTFDPDHDEGQARNHIRNKSERLKGINLYSCNLVEEHAEFMLKIKRKLHKLSEEP